LDIDYRKRKFDIKYHDDDEYEFKIDNIFDEIFFTFDKITLVKFLFKNNVACDIYSMT